MKENEHIDKIIRQNLFGAKIKVPDSAWSKISTEIDKLDRIKKIMLFQKLSGVAAIFLLFIILGIIFYLNPRTPQKISTNDSTNRTLKQHENKLILSDSIPKFYPQTTMLLSNNRLLQSHKKEIHGPLNFNDKTIIAYNPRIIFSKFIDSKQNTIPYIQQKKETTSPFAYDEIDEGFNTSDINGNKNWGISLNYSPGKPSINASEYPSSLLNSNFYNITIDGTSLPEAYENVQPSYTIGFNISFSMKGRWSIITGIQYLNQKNEVVNFRIQSNTADVGETIYITETKFGQIQLNDYEKFQEKNLYVNSYTLSTNSNIFSYNSTLVQHFDFLEIPLLLSYDLNHKKYAFSFIGGINSGFLIGNKTFIKNQASENIGITTNINPFVIKSVIGFSLEYPLNEHFYLTMTPTHKYQLNRINTGIFDYYHMHFFDIGIAIKYNF